MERMAGGQDTWARWKSVVLALPEAASRAYLRDIEGFGPDRIGCLLQGEDGAIAAADWEVTEDAKQALGRFETWEKGLAGRGSGAAILDYQEARAAALPNQQTPIASPNYESERQTDDSTI